MEKNNPNLLQIIEHCREACIDFITEHTGTSNQMVRCVDFCKDCEKMCETAASFVERGSYYSKRTLKLCSEMCHKCADELNKHFMGEGKSCSEACRHCAQECAAAS